MERESDLVGFGRVALGVPIDAIELALERGDHIGVGVGRGGHRQKHKRPGARLGIAKESLHG
ncbi:hypothetical protein J4558_26935 [Leptolyngbya sp. 15MV]|nr:hypothetical protein J4558_26935 [Leptolyngbya sp. 15MV]